MTNVTNRECCEIFKAAEDSIQKVTPEKEYYNEDFVKAYRFVLCTYRKSHQKKSIIMKTLSRHIG